MQLDDDEEEKNTTTTPAAFDPRLYDTLKSLFERRPDELLKVFDGALLDRIIATVGHEGVSTIGVIMVESECGDG